MLKAASLIFLSILLAYGGSLPSARGGTDSNSGFLTIQPPNYFDGRWVVGDYWYQGDGSTRTVTVLKPYIEYQGSSTDNPNIKVTLYEFAVVLVYGNVCNPTCVWGTVGASISSETQKWTSGDIQASSNTDLNWARQHPNSPTWATISIGTIHVQTSSSQAPPPCCGGGSQTVYYEYAAIDQDGYVWGVGYADGCCWNPNYYDGNGLHSMATVSWEYNWWGGNSWWQFNARNHGNIELTMHETWS